MAIPNKTKKESLIVGKIIMCKNTKMKTGTDSLFRGGMTKINKVQQVQHAQERAGDQTSRDVPDWSRGCRPTSGTPVRIDFHQPAIRLSAGTVHGPLGSWTLLRRPTLRDRRGGE